MFLLHSGEFFKIQPVFCCRCLQMEDLDSSSRIFWPKKPSVQPTSFWVRSGDTQNTPITLYKKNYCLLSTGIFPFKFFPPFYERLFYTTICPILLLRGFNQKFDSLILFKITGIPELSHLHTRSLLIQILSWHFQAISDNFWITIFFFKNTNVSYI